LASPQYTVLAPEGATNYTQQQGAFSVYLDRHGRPAATSKSSGEYVF